MKSICENCGAEFEQRSQYKSKWVKTCSYECNRALADRRMKATYAQKAPSVVKSVCEQCGADFTHKRSKPRTFCSRECSNKARSGEQHPTFQATESRTFPACVVCGEPTQHTQRTTCPEHRRGYSRQELATCPCGQPAANFKSKYCSDPCRKKWGVKPPTRMVTHSCQACGKDFERPHYYPGKKMFCSLACSNTQHSRKRARHYQFGDLNLNSSFELRFVACLERLQIEWEPWPDDDPQVYEHEDTGPHTYTPDFRLPGLAIETKGWDHPDSIQPLGRAAWDKPETLVIVDRGMLNELEHEFNRGRAFVILRKA